MNGKFFTLKFDQRYAYSFHSVGKNIQRFLCLLYYLSQCSFNVEDLITQKDYAYFLSLKIKNNKQRGEKLDICLLSWTSAGNSSWMFSNLVVFRSGPRMRYTTGLHARPPVSRAGRALLWLPLAPSPAVTQRKSPGLSPPWIPPCSVFWLWELSPLLCHSYCFPHPRLVYHTVISVLGIPAILIAEWDR